MDSTRGQSYIGTPNRSVPDLATYNHGSSLSSVELAWCSVSVMDCHAKAQGSIPGGKGVITELHVFRKGQ